MKPKEINLIFISISVIFFTSFLTANSHFQKNNIPKNQEFSPQEVENIHISDTKNKPIKANYAEPMVTYLIEAQLYPEFKKLTGTETITWQNQSPNPINSVRFHLYYNAFRNFETTFMKEGKYHKRFPSSVQQKELKFGEIKIKEIRQIGGLNLTENLRYISPDDGNPDDKTVMEIQLSDSIAPGDFLRLKIIFDLIIPQIFLRTGCEDHYFFMGQWFPKIGVLQSDGQWHCHQFHYNSEFFSNFANYRVWLTVPEEYIIGATGNLIKSEKNADNSTTSVFEENNIHDFAWTAYPHFTRYTETFQPYGTNDPLTVELLISPGHDEAKEKYLNILKFAINFYNKKLFPYPYKKITVVDTPSQGFMSGGMEYPTLITIDYLNFLGDSMRLIEQAIVHEYGHQYWYGIIANDELKEAWLDEGINTFFEQEILEKYFKHSKAFLDLGFIQINFWDKDRFYYKTMDHINPVKTVSWNFLNHWNYVGSVYSKPAILIKSLKNLLGEDQIYNFFKFYAKKFQYKHPNTQDFIETFNTFMDEDFSWAFDQFILSETILDHAVHSIDSIKISKDPKIFRNEAIFVRNEGYFPAEIVITLESGKEIRSFWKENKTWKKIIFEDPSPIKNAMIDPHFNVPLDWNFLNNSKVNKPKHSKINYLSMKLSFLFQNILSLLIL